MLFAHVGRALCLRIKLHSNLSRLVYPLQIVVTDILGSLPKSKNGNMYMLVASDYFTHWAEAYAILNQEAETVAKKLTNEMFCQFFIPEQ